MDRSLIEKVAAVLREAGFTNLETQAAANTEILAGEKDGVVAVLHLSDGRPPKQQSWTGFVPPEPETLTTPAIYALVDFNGSTPLIPPGTAPGGTRVTGVTG
jgi:hypothetical protein